VQRLALDGKPKNQLSFAPKTPEMQGVAWPYRPVGFVIT
jgi:hypothetical protein